MDSINVFPEIDYNILVFYGWLVISIGLIILGFRLMRETLSWSPTPIIVGATSLLGIGVYQIHPAVYTLPEKLNLIQAKEEIDRLSAKVSDLGARNTSVSKELDRERYQLNQCVDAGIELKSQLDPAVMALKQSLEPYQRYQSRLKAVKGRQPIEQLTGLLPILQSSHQKLLADYDRTQELLDSTQRDLSDIRSELTRKTKILQENTRRDRIAREAIVSSYTLLQNHHKDLVSGNYCSTLSQSVSESVKSSKQPLPNDLLLLAERLSQLKPDQSDLVELGSLISSLEVSTADAQSTEPTNVVNVAYTGRLKALEVLKQRLSNLDKRISEIVELMTASHCKTGAAKRAPEGFEVAHGDRVGPGNPVVVAVESAGAGAAVMAAARVLDGRLH